MGSIEGNSSVINNKIDNIMTDLLQVIKEDMSSQIDIFPEKTGALKQSVIQTLNSSVYDGSSLEVNLGSDLNYASEIEQRESLKPYPKPFNKFFEYLKDRLSLNFNRMKIQHIGVN